MTTRNFLHPADNAPATFFASKGEAAVFWISVASLILLLLLYLFRYVSGVDRYTVLGPQGQTMAAYINQLEKNNQDQAARLAEISASREEANRQLQVLRKKLEELTARESEKVERESAPVIKSGEIKLRIRGKSGSTIKIKRR